MSFNAAVPSGVAVSKPSGAASVAVCGFVPRSVSVAMVLAWVNVAAQKMTGLSSAVDACSDLQRGRQVLGDRHGLQRGRRRKRIGGTRFVFPAR